jgi:hypothetical protein
MAPKTETQAYRVVRKEGEFEIRYYPSAHLASTSVQGEARQMRNEGFRELAGYIFGNNEAGEKIAMTAPVIVEVEPGEKSGKMSFVMPADFDFDNKPRPKSRRISFSTTEPGYVATVSFGGFARESEMARQKARLFAFLNRKGIKYDPHAEYLYYNPPFQLLGRRNEVRVRLTDFRE